MDRRKIEKITPFLRRVQKMYHPEKIVLFGSRAKGTAKNDSDYDLLVISKDFRKIQFYQRMVGLYHLKRGLSVSMDIIGLTPEEFEQKRQRTGVIQDAYREGVEVTV